MFWQKTHTEWNCALSHCTFLQDKHAHKHNSCKHPEANAIHIFYMYLVACTHAHFCYLDTFSLATLAEVKIKHGSDPVFRGSHRFCPCPSCLLLLFPASRCLIYNSVAFIMTHRHHRIICRKGSLNSKRISKDDLCCLQKVESRLLDLFFVEDVSPINQKASSSFFSSELN